MIYFLAFLYGIFTYQIALFTLKAYWRYKENKKFQRTIDSESKAFLRYTSPKVKNPTGGTGGNHVH